MSQGFHRACESLAPEVGAETEQERRGAQPEVVTKAFSIASSAQFGHTCDRQSRREQFDAVARRAVFADVLVDLGFGQGEHAGRSVGGEDGTFEAGEGPVAREDPRQQAVLSTIALRAARIASEVEIEAGLLVEPEPDRADSFFAVSGSLLDRSLEVLGAGVVRATGNGKLLDRDPLGPRSVPAQGEDADTVPSVVARPRRGEAIALESAVRKPAQDRDVDFDHEDCPPSTA